MRRRPGKQFKEDFTNEIKVQIIEVLNDSLESGEEEVEVEETIDLPTEADLILKKSFDINSYYS
jgi:hypothetical protein